MAPSAVWIYLKKINNGSNVQCHKCKKQLKYKNSTTSLIKHLRQAHNIDLPASKANREDSDSHDEILTVGQPKQVNIYFYV